GHRLNETERQPPAADWEIIHRALRLRAPQRRLWYRHFAQGILLHPCVVHDRSPQPGSERSVSARPGWTSRGARAIPAIVMADTASNRPLENQPHAFETGHHFAMLIDAFHQRVNEAAIGFGAGR